MKKAVFQFSGVATVVAAATLAVCGGCQTSGADPRTQPRVAAAPIVSGGKAVGTYTVLQQTSGNAFFVVGSGGTIEVWDTTDQRTIFRGPVAPQTLVKIDRTAGISLGDRVVLKGPLPSGHRLELRQLRAG